QLSGFMDGQFSLPSVDLEDDYAAMLAESRYRDSGAGRTLEGPHRADLILHHREKAMEAERCSTDETRMRKHQADKQRFLLAG
ncbi:hypothetical protein ACC736_38935, partial [Rhizobium ruizarguesonis]